jgi:hypothetical protein
MKRLMLAGFVLGLLLCPAEPLQAEPIICDLTNGVLSCDLNTPTPEPTATPTPSITPTATARPPSATPTPQPTPTPAPTSTPTTVALTRPFPPNGTDGRITITQAGVYSGAVSCGAITGGDYCLNVFAQNVTLQDFSVSAPQAPIGAILTSSNTTFLRGTVSGRGGISGYRVSNVLIDGVTFNVTVGAIGIYDFQDNCEGLTTKRVRNIVIRNSFVNSTGTGNETIWMKCSQDVLIENSRITTSASWAMSFPDALNVTVRNNTFDLNHARTWLGIEFPRTFGAKVEGNTFLGTAGDWATWNCCGSTGLSYTGNVLAPGVGLVCCLTPPSTGDAGLKGGQ